MSHIVYGLTAINIIKARELITQYNVAHDTVMQVLETLYKRRKIIYG